MAGTEARPTDFSCCMGRIVARELKNGAQSAPYTILTAYFLKPQPADLPAFPGRRRRFLGGVADGGDGQELLVLFPEHL